MFSFFFPIKREESREESRMKKDICLILGWLADSWIVQDTEKFLVGQHKN